MWTHIAFTWHRPSGRAVLYLDGVQSAELNQTSGQINKDLKLTREQVFYIGRHNGFPAFFDGWMSDLVMIFQTLSQHEIVQLLQGTVVSLNNPRTKQSIVTSTKSDCLIA